MRNTAIAILIFCGLGLVFLKLLPDEQIEEPEKLVIQEPVIEPQEPPTDEIECMTINTYHEARDQSVAGQVAVMHVVMNRVKSDKFPNTICGVVTEGPTYVNWKGNTWPVRDQCQFSWYCDGVDDTATDISAYKRIQELAELVITSDYHDFTEGSTHYHADYVKPKWSKTFRKITKIDSHIFYNMN